MIKQYEHDWREGTRAENSMRVWLWCYLMSPRVIHSWPTFGEQNSLHVEWLWLNSAKERKNTERQIRSNSTELTTVYEEVGQCECITSHFISHQVTLLFLWELLSFLTTEGQVKAWSNKGLRKLGLELLNKMQTSQISFTVAKESLPLHWKQTELLYRL